MDDSIRRQDAIDAMCKACPLAGECPWCDECDELVALRAVPSAQPEQRWIPCSERLPVDDDYRESMECLDGCVWYFTDKESMGLGHYFYSTKEWFTLRDLKPDGKVIAWMPLPKPYEAERKEEREWANRKDEYEDPR